MNRIFGLIGLSFLLFACATSNNKTLGDLEYKQQKERKIEFAQLDYEEVRKEYEEILSLFEDENLKEQIERRIAEVYMLEGEEKLIQSKPTSSQYTQAIKSYQKILKKYPNSPDNAEVLYQLARAYEIEGQLDKALEMLIQLSQRHPYYKNIVEAHFRMGEIYYTKQAYFKAQKEYLLVTQSKQINLLNYAHYMLGWTYYKQSNYLAAVKSFSRILNLVLINETNLDKLIPADKSMAKDAIHSLSLALARSGGAEIIESEPLLKSRTYLWYIYDDLGDYYLEKQRYEDSADTFRRYVQRFNYSAQAPRLHSKLISAYIKGGFPLQALAEKEQYVKYYALDSKYAKQNNGVNDKILADLKVYLVELSAHYHSKGQKTSKLLLSAKKGMLDKIKLSKASSDSKEYYLRAVAFYSQYIDTFKTDVKIPEFTFLRGEARFELKKFPEAIDDYESVAYGLKSFKQNTYKARAGYAVIISYQDYIKSLNQSSKKAKQWQSKAVEAMLKFAQVFYQDKRSPSVLTNAAEYLFGLGHYQRALEVANKLIANDNMIDKKLNKTAHGIAAHSHFKLNQFDLAKTSYERQRKLTKPGSKEYNEISERLAASLYKRSEELITVGDKAQAIKRLMAIKTKTPTSKIRVMAQYNAVTLMLELEQWNESIVELKELIQLYPKDKFSPEFPRKLAFAYEKKQAWNLAAKAYLSLSENDIKLEVRQNSLFIAAGLYEKINSDDTAIRLYKKYARTFEKPFEIRMEARYKLASLYEKVKDYSKQLFWLRRIIDGDIKAGKQRNERSRWLGAWANIKYGDYFASEFRRYKLTIQLNKTLPRKNKALSDATSRYEAASDYGILEFITQSRVKMANLYLQLSDELRRVKLPTGLSKHDQSQYMQVLNQQAAPFDAAAAELHMTNIESAWQGEFNSWIKNSFDAMKKLSPARFNKAEATVSYGNGIR